MERDIFPFTDLESWIHETAIWHFADEDCETSRRLKKLYYESELRGRTIRLHPVYREDLDPMYENLSARNVRQLLDSVPSAFFPTLPMNSLRYPAGYREVPLVGRPFDMSQPAERDRSTYGREADVLLHAVEQVDASEDGSEQPMRTGNVSIDQDQTDAEPAGNADDDSGGDPEDPNKANGPMQPDHPMGQAASSTRAVNVEYSFDWEPSFKKNESIWQAESKPVLDTDMLANVYQDLLATVEAKLDQDKDTTSTGPRKLIKHRQVALMTAEPGSTGDFVRDWAMRQDLNGQPRIETVGDCLIDPCDVRKEGAVQLRICAKSTDTAWQSMFGIEPETDASGKEIDATAMARYDVIGPLWHHLVGRELLEGENFTDLRGDDYTSIDSRICLIMRVRREDDYQTGGTGLLQVRTWFFRGILVYDLDNAVPARDPLPKSVSYEPLYLDHRLTSKSTGALSTIFDECDLDIAERAWRRPLYTYCFNTFKPQGLGIGVSRIGQHEIVVAARYVNHFNHVDHLKDVSHLQYLKTLKHAASSTDFSHSRRDRFDDDASYAKIRESVERDMRDELPKLFKAPLQHQWQLELWVLPQIGGGTKFHRFTEDVRLSHFLNPVLFEQGDLRLFMEVHIVPKIAEEPRSRRGDVSEKRRRLRGTC